MHGIGAEQTIEIARSDALDGGVIVPMVSARRRSAFSVSKEAQDAARGVLQRRFDRVESEQPKRPFGVGGEIASCGSYEVAVRSGQRNSRASAFFRSKAYEMRSFVQDGPRVDYLPNGDAMCSRSVSGALRGGEDLAAFPIDRKGPDEDNAGEGPAQRQGAFICDRGLPRLGRGARVAKGDGL